MFEEEYRTFFTKEVGKETIGGKDAVQNCCELGNIKELLEMM